MIYVCNTIEKRQVYILEGLFDYIPARSPCTDHTLCAQCTFKLYNNNLNSELMSNLLRE